LRAQKLVNPHIDPNRGNLKPSFPSRPAHRVPAGRHPSTIGRFRAVPDASGAGDLAVAITIAPGPVQAIVLSAGVFTPDLPKGV